MSKLRTIRIGRLKLYFVGLRFVDAVFGYPYDFRCYYSSSFLHILEVLWDHLFGPEDKQAMDYFVAQRNEAIAREKKIQNLTRHKKRLKKKLMLNSPAKK